MATGKNATPSKSIKWPTELRKRVERQCARLNIKYSSTYIDIALGERLLRDEQDEKEEE